MPLRLRHLLLQLHPVLVDPAQGQQPQVRQWLEERGQLKTTAVRQEPHLRRQVLRPLRQRLGHRLFRDGLRRRRRIRRRHAVQRLRVESILRRRIYQMKGEWKRNSIRRPWTGGWKKDVSK